LLISEYRKYPLNTLFSTRSLRALYGCTTLKMYPAALSFSNPQDYAMKTECLARPGVGKRSGPATARREHDAPSLRLSRSRLLLLVALALSAFAGNSLLCRIALKATSIDAATFTTVRIVSGALALWLIVRLRYGVGRLGGDLESALALFAYAATFSFAYAELPAGTGALLLFGAVQATMIGYGLSRGERLHGRQIGGLALALAGLVGLVLPGLAAPPLRASLLMLASGAAWSIYSLRGRGGGDPLRATAGNFLRAVPFAVALAVATRTALVPDTLGIALAITSGTLTSGVGYAIWYSALPSLSATRAATVQLSVPVIAALGGIAFLGEQPTWRLTAAAVAILGGIALVIGRPRQH
jgi:drug/metabolite transporter (DMT)-like permease